MNAGTPGPHPIGRERLNTQHVRFRVPRGLYPIPVLGYLLFKRLREQTLTIKLGILKKGRV